ncbi:hypothetical protein MMC10_005924 [Thelotrema lepadinum]|nr:hypothetical protein [Thelotrema lepadinum]
MPKQAHLRKTLACTKCQSLKVKCLPSDRGEICQKCVRSGAECVFRDQKPRRKCERPDSRTRLAALESKLEGLIAQVSNQSSGSYGDGNESLSPSESANQSRSTTFRDTPSTLNTTDQSPTPELETRDRTHAATFARFSSDGATPEALISHSILSTEDVDSYIGRFREMSSFFPFVAIPDDVAVYALLQDRPLVLHAALAVATSSEVHLQKTLEKSFKELMLRKLVLEAQKSIDLFQSLLICIAWGQFFSIPKRDQSYQFLQMAYGLFIDLGLNLTPAVAMQEKPGLHLDRYQLSGEDDADRFWSREARRAILGCYHLSTLNSWIWAKPKTLEYSDYILQCAKSISENPEYTTDELILPLVQAHAIGDEYHEVMRVGRGGIHSQPHLDRIGTHIRSFQKRVNDVKSTLTPFAASSVAVQLALHFTFVYTYEQDLISPFISTSRLMAVAPSIDPKSSPIDVPSRIDMLIDCLAAAASCLDHFLTIPASSYPLLCTAQWSSLTFSIAITYRLSIGTPRIPLWDVQIARETVKLENYLTLLCEMVQNETRNRLKAIIDTHQHRDLYSLTGLILQNVRNTYERLRRLPQAQSAADEETVHAISFPDAAIDVQNMPVPRPGPIFGQQEQPKSGYQSRCPALQFWNTPESSNASVDPLMADDPFSSMSSIDDDGFWSQAFADMVKAGEQWGSGVDQHVLN